MVKARNFVSQKAFSNFLKLQSKTNQTNTSNKTTKIIKNCTIFEPKNS